jgi:hypothetical protein
MSVDSKEKKLDPAPIGVCEDVKVYLSTNRPFKLSGKCYTGAIRTELGIGQSVIIADDQYECLLSRVIEHVFKGMVDLADSLSLPIKSWKHTPYCNSIGTTPFVFYPSDGVLIIDL